MEVHAEEQIDQLQMALNKTPMDFEEVSKRTPIRSKHVANNCWRWAATDFKKEVTTFNGRG